MCVCFSLQFVTRKISIFFFIQYTDVLAVFHLCDKHNLKKEFIRAYTSGYQPITEGTHDRNPIRNWHRNHGENLFTGLLTGSWSPSFLFLYWTKKKSYNLISSSNSAQILYTFLLIGHRFSPFSRMNENSGHKNKNQGSFIHKIPGKWK